MAWLTGWGKRKKLPSVISADGALADYQLIRSILTRTPKQWEASKSWAAGQLIAPTGYPIHECTVGGTGGTTAPVWSATNNATVTDGATVVWKCRTDIVLAPSASFKNTTLDDLRITEGDGVTVVPHHIPGRSLRPLLSSDCAGVINRSAWFSDGTLVASFFDNNERI